jgi:hypothetical protein
MVYLYLAVGASMGALLFIYLKNKRRLRMIEKALAPIKIREAKIMSDLNGLVDQISTASPEDVEAISARAKALREQLREVQRDTKAALMEGRQDLQR